MLLGKKLTVLVMLTLVSMAAVGGCIGSNTGVDDNQPEGQAVEWSGSIQIAGSTSVQGLSEELAAEFMARYPKVKINVAGGGSGAGIKSAQEGTADIGSSSRELKPAEKQVNEILIAKDGIVIIVHKDNGVGNLTMAQVKELFGGKITSWKELGGEDAPITLVVREEGSGTRGAFEEIVMGKDRKISDKALVQNSTGAVRTAVADNPDAVGFISLGSLNPEVKALNIDDVAASKESILDGSYRIARPFLYLTKAEPQGVTKAFIDFILSSDGQKIVGESFIPAR